MTHGLKPAEGVSAGYKDFQRTRFDVVIIAFLSCLAHDHPNVAMFKDTSSEHLKLIGGNCGLKPLDQID